MRHLAPRHNVCHSIRVQSPDDVYERARSGGLSHETATQVAQHVAHPRLGRAPLSGAWPRFVAPPVADTGYAGPAPTIDSVLWLRKLGMALASQWVMPRLAAAGLPLITNARTRVEDWHRDGCLALDLEHRHVGGRRAYTTCRVQISACLAHDTGYVLMRVLSHLGQRNVVTIENALLNETDLRHVAG